MFGKKRKKKGQNHEMLDEMEKMINNFFFFAN